MSTDLFTVVTQFDRQLGTAEHLLARAEAHGEGEAMLGWRLIDDMHPLAFQLRVLCDFARNWTARVAGLDTVDAPSLDLDLAGWRAALAATRAWLGTLTRDQLVARDDAPLTIELMPGMAPTLPAGQWLTGFAATNIYFHLSMVYAILRARGVPLGKRDLFSGGV